MCVPSSTRQDSGKHVLVVGAGNIGSHFVSHLPRMPGVARITLVDRDLYEQKNLCSQDITAHDVGKAKATVQAQRVRRINPALHITAVVEDVENLPLGSLRADVIVACVDSRRTRQYLNQTAWRLGVPWIDAGVQGDSLLARVNVYVPGPDSPCLECAWDQRDYEALEQTYPCELNQRPLHPAPLPPGAREPDVEERAIPCESGLRAMTSPTNAPSSLGALAAALQAIECQKLLTGHYEQVAASRQVLIDAAYHRHYVTTFRRNPGCRFDHALWTIERVKCRPQELTLRDVFALREGSNGEGSSSALRIEGRTFIRQLTCPGCGRAKPLWRFAGPLHHGCRCGQQLVAAGHEMTEWLTATELPWYVLARSLHRLGIRSGDVITLRSRTEEHNYQIGI